MILIHEISPILEAIKSGNHQPVAVMFSKFSKRLTSQQLLRILLLGLNSVNSFTETLAVIIETGSIFSNSSWKISLAPLAKLSSYRSSFKSENFSMYLLIPYIIYYIKFQNFFYSNAFGVRTHEFIPTAWELIYFT